MTAKHINLQLNINRELKQIAVVLNINISIDNFYLYNCSQLLFFVKIIIGVSPLLHH